MNMMISVNERDRVTGVIGVDNDHAVMMALPEAEDGPEPLKAEGRPGA